MFDSGRVSSTWRTILILLLVCAVAAGLKLRFFGTTHSGDYDTYLEAARYISGEHVIPSAPFSIPERLIKPLAPAVVALLHAGGLDYFSAMLTQALAFYAAFVVAIYFLALEFFEDRRVAVYAVLLSALSYPVLKYGVDVLTETGAIFWYTLALLASLRFIKDPRWSKLVLAAGAVIVGFLWKEYSVVAGGALGLALIFHPRLLLRQKAAYIAAFAALFLAVMVPWELYVFHHFGFTYADWYRIGGASGFSYEYTPFKLLKSTIGVIGLMWLAVPFGVRRFGSLTEWQKLFVGAGIPPTLACYVWGYVSSRLFYVMAPPFLFLALYGIRDWSVRKQNAFVGIAVVANLVWLGLSYRIVL